MDNTFHDKIKSSSDYYREAFLARKKELDMHKEKFIDWINNAGFDGELIDYRNRNLINNFESNYLNTLSDVNSDTFRSWALDYLKSCNLDKCAELILKTCPYEELEDYHNMFRIVTLLEILTANTRYQVYIGEFLDLVKAKLFRSQPKLRKLYDAYDINQYKSTLWCLAAAKQILSLYGKIGNKDCWEITDENIRLMKNFIVTTEFEIKEKGNIEPQLSYFQSTIIRYEMESDLGGVVRLNQFLETNYEDEDYNEIQGYLEARAMLMNTYKIY